MTDRINRSHLNNKWRPTSFEDVVGQERALKMLKAYIESGFNTPVIFDGPYGTGKTTLTKILASCYHTPAKDVWAGAHPDIIQINAANKTGVKEIEKLLDTVQYNPLAGLNKTYIIDEFHALSHAAYNAFLQTLEECPANVRFFFATTEKYKIPDAVLSRCFVLTLNPVGRVDIRARLELIAKQEKIDLPDRVLDLIAVHSSGSVRDAVKCLEQINMLGANPNINDVYNFLEVPPEDELRRIVFAIEKGNYDISVDMTNIHPYAVLSALLRYINVQPSKKWVPVTQSLLEVLDAVKFGLDAEVILNIALAKAVYMYQLDNYLDSDQAEKQIKGLFPKAVLDE